MSCHEENEPFEDDDTELVTLEECTILGETDSAFHVRHEGKSHWLPKSQVDDPDRLSPGDKNITIVIPAWLADDRGIQ